MDKDFDIIVAGGGIAGLSAAVYSARLGHRTLVLGGNVPGGLLLSIERIEGVPGFPEGVPGYDLCPMTQEQAEAAGARFAAAELERVERDGDRWHVAAGGAAHSARAVILAMGAQLRALGVPGEAEFQGRGVSHCASCDAPLLRGKVVAVVGSGDSAMQESLHLASHASKVIMLHRGSTLRGHATYRERVLANPRIEHRFETVVSEILGREAVTGVRTLAVGGGEPADIEVAAVFVYIGLEPNTATVRDVVDLDDSGRIRTDACLRTARQGLLAAGIVRAGTSGQAAGAAGDGVAAAIAADRYLREGIWS